MPRMWRGSLVLAAIVLGCAPALTSQGRGVAVYVAKSGGAAKDNQMPEGCRLVAEKPPVIMTEAEIAVQRDPYRVARNEAGAAGANALLVRSRMREPRRSFNCPSSAKITDCPGNSGAWFDVVFESYACTPEALRVLSAPPPASPRPSAAAAPAALGAS
jgi:hypothetical protein